MASPDAGDDVTLTSTRSMNTTFSVGHGCAILDARRVARPPHRRHGISHHRLGHVRGRRASRRRAGRRGRRGNAAPTVLEHGLGRIELRAVHRADRRAIGEHAAALSSSCSVAGFGSDPSTPRHRFRTRGAARSMARYQSPRSVSTWPRSSWSTGVLPSMTVQCRVQRAFAAALRASVDEYRRAIGARVEGGAGVGAFGAVERSSRNARAMPRSGPTRRRSFARRVSRQYAQRSFRRQLRSLV